MWVKRGFNIQSTLNYGYVITTAYNVRSPERENTNTINAMMTSSNGVILRVTALQYDACVLHFHLARRQTPETGLQARFFKGLHFHLAVATVSLVTKL